MVRLLIIDDDDSMNRALANIAEYLGMVAFCAMTLEKGLEFVRREEIDLILMDVKLPDGNGIQAMSSFLEAPSRPEIIIITGYADMKSAEKALKQGAWDYIQKPFSSDELMLIMTRAMEYRKQKIKSKMQPIFAREEIIGNSSAISRTFEQAAQAAACEANVLITGETGTGKELFARAIHRNSMNKDGSLVVVDCAAITEHLAESMLFGHDKGAFTGAGRDRQGLVRQADQGTLFLDEIGELPLDIQKKFLRFLQEHEFRPVGSDLIMKSSFKLISATNRDLEFMVKQGQFRRDLMFRLRGIDIKIPPLRDRKEDIKAIIGEHAKQYCDKKKMKRKIFSPCLIEALLGYDWPGNIRELFIVMDKVLATACFDSTLYAFHLPPLIRLSRARDSLNGRTQPAPGSDLPSFRVSQEANTKKYLNNLLLAAKGDRNKACRISGLSKSYLYKLLKEYNVRLAPQKSCE